jgi:heme b synthase
MKRNELRLVAWEVTKKCNLNCSHCRAGSDVKSADGPDKKRAFQILDQVKEVGTPVVILTGGEPLLKPELFDIARYGASLGLKMVLATNGTLINAGVVKEIKDSGIKRVSVSIDSSKEKVHDEFRNTKGAFKAAIEGINLLREGGVEFQINTTVTKHNINEIEDIMNMAVRLGAVAHHLFLLVPTGRARGLKDKQIKSEEYERLLLWLCRKKEDFPLHIKPTCAPQYYRILRQQKTETGTKKHGLDMLTKGCLGGISFCFISAEEIVQPCGYLELNCGDLKKNSFSDIWNNSDVFKRLRDFSLYKGKCGRCEYVKFCGGCRARAYEYTGDYLEEDPLCCYSPSRDSDENMDSIDKSILNEIQSNFPITSEPFKSLGERLGISEEEVIHRIKVLKEKGIIRRIGGNFHSSRLNFVSTLCAAKVPEDKIDVFVREVNKYPGVTHNYLRNGRYNIWFTFIAESMDYIEEALKNISQKTGIRDIINLPAVKMFKIKVDFEL